MLRTGIAFLATMTMVTAAQARSHRHHHYTMARHGEASYHSYRGYVTAARGIPRGSILIARNPRNGKSARLRVVDSGPYVHGRVLDVSPRAFRHLYGSLHSGHGPVSYRVVQVGHGAMTGRP